MCQNKSYQPFYITILSILPSNNSFSLQGLIEDTYKSNNNTRVVVISHSLGGLTMSTFLHSVSKQWKDKYIHAWVSAAGVFGGAVKVGRIILGVCQISILF